MNALLQLCSIQFKSFYREPAILFWAILFPILMAWVLGIAFNKKGDAVKKVMIIWDIQNGKSSARDIIGNPTGEEIKKRIGDDIYAPTIVHFIPGKKEDAVKALKR